MNLLETKLKSVLSQFFRDQYYSQAVKELRKSLSNQSSYAEHWEQIVRMILAKELSNPLDFVHNIVNQVLDDNSDDEAYKWLNLMLINSLGSENSMIIEY